MIWTAKLALLTVGLLAIGGAAAATTNPTALAHMSENAKGALAGHRDATPECGEWRNHGEYVSSIANAANDESADDNDAAEDRDDNRDHATADDREDRSAERSMTREERTDAREDETDAEDNADSSAVREAAQSEIGKGCQHTGRDQVLDDDSRDESDDEDVDETEETVTHGQSAEHRHQKS